MAGEQYIVKGQVVVDGSQANAAISRLTGGISNAQSMTQRMGGGISSMLTRVGGLAAGFLGVRAAVGQVSNALNFHNQLEQSTAGLAALFRTVGHEGFAQSMQHASTAFVEIDELAASAYGETSDLFNIMRAGYSDLTRMNVAWEDQKTLIRDVANTAGIVGESLDFVGRDLQEMLAGRAHMGTNQLFTRVMAPLGISTEDFNALPELERLQKIREVMSSMGGGEGAAAVGATLGAQMSTLVSKFNMIRESFFKPFFAPNGLITRAITRVTEALGGPNTTRLMDSMSRLGYSMSGYLAPMFDGIANVLVYLINNFDSVVQRVRATVSQLVGLLAKVAAVRVGIGAAGMAQGAIAMAPQMTAGIAAIQAAWVTPIPAILAAMNPIVWVFGLVASLGLAVAANWQMFLNLFQQASPIFAYVSELLWSTLGSFWDVFSSIGQIIGELIGPAVMIALGAALAVFVLGLKALKFIFDSLMIVLAPLRDAIHSVFSAFLESISYILAVLGRPIQSGTAGGGLPSLSDIVSGNVPAAAAGAAAAPETPAGRQHPAHNDFRGSNIRINQEFKEADPDRVMFRVINDINRQAERRISSGMTNPLTR